MGAQALPDCFDWRIACVEPHHLQHHGNIPGCIMTFNLIIAGSRHIVMDPWTLWEIIQAQGVPHADLIIEGGCRMPNHITVDCAARELAAITGKPWRTVRADWEAGREIMRQNPNIKKNPAGPIRNAKMAEMGHALLLIWDGKSDGSQSMKTEALRRGLRIWEVIL